MNQALANRYIMRPAKRNRMTENLDINHFLSHYNEQVQSNALKLREILDENLPDIQEQIDIPARMIAYTYGPKYAEMICTIIL